MLHSRIPSVLMGTKDENIQGSPQSVGQESIPRTSAAKGKNHQGNGNPSSRNGNKSDHQRAPHEGDRAGNKPTENIKARRGKVEAPLTHPMAQRGRSEH